MRLLLLLAATGLARAAVDRPQTTGLSKDKPSRTAQYLWKPSSDTQFEVPSGYYFDLYRCTGDGSTDTELARSARLFLFVMGFGLMSSLAIWV